MLWGMAAACSPEDVDLDGDGVDDGDTTFRIALLADPHVIGDGYTCCESPGLDTESIYKSRRRFETTRGLVNDLDPAPAAALLAGDLMHDNYRFDAIEDYTDPDLGSSAFHARRILDGFTVPVHVAWGNHDYGDDRSFSHRLFREVFDTEPYYAVEIGGWKFVMLDTQFGTATDPMDGFVRRVDGTLGAEQLAWLADELAEGMPTILVGHHHPLAGTLQADEDPGGPWPDVYTVVETYADVVRGVFFGHLHRWVDVGDFMGVPAWVIGGIRYDADNFWVAELEQGGEDWSIVDYDKAVWGSVNGLTAVYDDEEVVLDPSREADYDPAGPWDGWTTPPDPWPPEDD